MTGLITVSWETTEPYGIFDILVSYDNEETFNILGTAENAVTYSFAPEEFGLLYIKAVQTTGERTAESNICPVANTAEEIDWEDAAPTATATVCPMFMSFMYTGPTRKTPIRTVICSLTGMRF